MKNPKAEDVKRGIADLWETLQCPICLDLMSTPVSTKCDHQFCKLCMQKLLDSRKQQAAHCPVCKTNITRRSLQESAVFQRLIRGLKNMIQAYEHDTCTNYFTGKSLQRREPITTEAEADTVLSGDVPANSLDHGEKEEHLGLTGSHSSTVAAQRGFARLMALEDEENEVSDHHLSDPLQTADEIMRVHRTGNPFGDYLEPITDKEKTVVVEKSTSSHRTRGKKRIAQLENSSCQLVLVPEEEQQRTSRESPRNKRKKGIEPDKALEQTQKSLEKVAEWLKQVPSAPEKKSEKNPGDSVDSASPTESCSSRVDEAELNSKTGERGKSLEKRVFGAVYKRRKRYFSPSFREFVDPSVMSPPHEAGPPEKPTKRKESNGHTPADFVKKPFSEGNGERALEGQLQMVEQLNDATGDVLKQPMLSDFNSELNNTEKQREGPGELLQEKDLEAGGSLLFDTLLHTLEEKSTKRMPHAMRDVDSDLRNQATAEPETMEKRRAVKKKGKNTKRGKGASSRGTKPLVLVSVRDGESNPETAKVGPWSEEVQVQIEHYPSSEELGTPARRVTRSRRLKLFAEEVQRSHKSHGKKESASKVKNHALPSVDKIVVTHCGEVETGTPDDTACSQNPSVENAVKRNGCVCDEDMGGIEKMESTESMMTRLSATEGFTPTGSFADVPNTKSPCEASAFYVASVTIGRSPTEATVPDMRLKSVGQANPPPKNARLEDRWLEKSACQNKCVEVEEEQERNDSELDTEQMLRSFKATKRKSFCLGSPLKRKGSVTPERERLDSGSVLAVDLSARPGPLAEAATNRFSANTKEHSDPRQGASQEGEDSSCGSLIPLSNLPGQEACMSGLKPPKVLIEGVAKSDETVDCSPFGATGKTHDSHHSLSGNSVCSALSPNKVPINPTCCSAVSRALDFGLLFTAPSVPVEGSLNSAPAPAKPSQINENKRDGVKREKRTLPQSGESHCVSAETSANNRDSGAGDSLELAGNTEASLTPDGLVAAPSQRSSDPSSLSPVKRNTKKRRKAQRLDSSPEPDCNSGEEEMPSLAQILKSSAVEQNSSSLIGVHARNRRGSGDAGGCEEPVISANSAEQSSGPPPCPSPDRVDSSQASVDLFGTPNECDVPVHDTCVSVESSQFLSELLVTQQKEAMQEELVRLEKLMALVSEVLQEKEDSPAAKVPSVKPSKDQCPDTRGHDLHMPEPCDRATELSPGSETPPDLGGRRLSSPRPGPETRPCNALQMSGQIRRSERLCGSPKAVGALESGAKATDRAPDTISRSPPVGHDVCVARASTMHSPLTEKSEAKLLVVTSGLDSNEQVMVRQFARRTGARVASQMSAAVTHVVMCTDERLVCERTLKYFLGIAGRKWVVSFQWISECLKRGKLLDESPFEVQGDVVNGPNHQGPTRARTTEDQNLLMKGYKICFQGSFTNMTTDQLEWMAELCGASAVKDPLLFHSKSTSRQLVVVQPGALTCSDLHGRATAVTRAWLLDSVATYTLQNHQDYAP